MASGVVTAVLLAALAWSSWTVCADDDVGESLETSTYPTSSLEADPDDNVVASFEDDAGYEEVGPSSPTQSSFAEDATEEDEVDVGEKLFLTPYLEAGQLEEARNLSKVTGGPFPDHVESYSGFLTIDPQFDSNLFFWFFPAENNYLDAPVIVWLQGGPGQPSLIGIFMEIGPFTVAEDHASLKDNPYSWHKTYSVLFIDNPVGSGFSFTNDELGYASNQTEIGQGLYNAVLQFFALFPELQKNPFFVAGESYGGKHAVSLAHFIHNGNPTANITINLKGLFTVSGFFDPVSSLHYSELLYQVGLVDFNDRKTIKIMEQKGREYIHQGKYEEALQQWLTILNYCQQRTHIYQNYNFMTETYPTLGEKSAYFKFVQRPEVRRAIHVGAQDVVYVGEVYRSLGADIVRSVKRWLEEILDAGYRVVCFSGQLDVIVAYPLSERMYLSLKFAATDEYRHARRRTWVIDGELAGYVKTAGNFTEVMVRGAGHMVPMDKPKWILSFVDDVISLETNKTLNPFMLYYLHNHLNS